MENSAGPAAADLQREERLLAGNPDPVLLFYSWPDPALVLGHGQGPGGLDLDFARNRDIVVVRRSTGGTGVFHHDDLAVSLILPAHHPWARGIRSLYDRMTGILSGALLDLGVRTERPAMPAGPSPERPSLCFADHTVETLLVGGRKSVGCSQARRRTGVLIHAFLLFNDDLDATSRLFDLEPAEVARLITPLPLTRASRPELKSAVIQRLSEALELEPVAIPLPT